MSFRRSPDAAWQTIAHETVVLDMAGRVLFGLNPVGARVWTLLDGQRSLADIASTIAAEFAQSPERVACDVLEFLDQLAAQNLVLNT